MIKNVTLAVALCGSNLLADIDLKEEVEIRFGVQSHDSDEDMSLGGRLHIEGDSILQNLSGGVSFATTNLLFGKNDSKGVRFFDSNSKSYSILQEAYLKYTISNTTLKVGRQIIDTPFADSDDVGMIANSFEAYKLSNSDLADALFTVLYLSKFSGVDSDLPKSFSKLNDNRGVLALGAAYNGISDLTLNSWFYNMPSTAKYTYADMEYSREFDGIEYAFALQYALQDYAVDKDASIYGVGVSVGYSGLNFALSYNKSADGIADNGYGGGAFLTSMEHLTLAEAGADGEVLSYGFEVEVVDGAVFYISNANLKSSRGKKADELDLVLSYEASKRLAFDLIYSKVDDDINGDSFNNSRFFANYSF